MTTSADVSVRIAWPDDAKAIAALQAKAWRHAYGDAVAESAPADLDDRWGAIIAAPRDARVRVLVALEGPTVRGYALVHPCHDADADQVADGEIGEFVVDADHRGVGHGSRLMQACVDTLSADTFSRAVWWVGSTDDALRQFTAAAGWAPDGAHRELQSDDGATLKQVRLHAAIG